MEENDVILDIIGQCHYSDIDDYLIHYKRFENHLVYEMIVSSIRFNDEVISNLWTIFWNNITLF